MRISPLSILLPLCLTACFDKPEDSAADTADSSADTDTDTTLEFTPLTPEEGVATDIILEIYSDGWGSLLETWKLTSEGSVVVAVEEAEPYHDPAQYYVYAKADGFYTELYRCGKYDEIEVDLDAVPDATGAITGVIFGQQGFFADHYLGSTTLTITGPGGGTVETTADAQGRYGLGDLDAGDYGIDFVYEEVPFTFTVTNGEGSDYEDLYFDDPDQAAKPNLYLYPQTTTWVDVVLGFPAGGAVTVSDPPYGDGWHVQVEPDGTIDGSYGYLFYEASVPQQLDTATGWLLDGGQLEAEWRALLADLGFQGAEIDDFVEYWVPRIEGWPWYAVYPQDPEPMVTLSIDPEPDSVLRFLPLVHPLPSPIELTEPAVEPFTRDGFTAVEWGLLVQ